MEIIESTKRRPSALYKGYRYRIERTSKSDVIHWRCVKEKSDKCRGRMSSKDNNVLTESSHNCQPDHVDNEIQKTMYFARVKARDEIKPISQIYHEVMDKLGYVGSEMAKHSSVRQSLYRVRRRSQVGLDTKYKFSETNSDAFTVGNK